jgi:hypothetical protein
MLSQHLFCVTLILHFYNLSPNLGDIHIYILFYILFHCLLSSEVMYLSNKIIYKYKNMFL